MITMLGLFIVVTLVEQRLFVLPNTAGKRSYMAPTLVLISGIFMIYLTTAGKRSYMAPTLVLYSGIFMIYLTTFIKYAL